MKLSGDELSLKLHVVKSTGNYAQLNSIKRQYHLLGLNICNKPLYNNMLNKLEQLTVRFHLYVNITFASAISLLFWGKIHRSKRIALQLFSFFLYIFFFFVGLLLFSREAYRQSMLKIAISFRSW